MAVSIPGLDTDLISQYTSESSSLKKALDTDKTDATDEELMDACKQFEQYFVEQVIKETKKTLPDDELLSEDDYMNMFGDRMIQAAAEKVTESGELGLAQQLYENMSRQQGSSRLASADQTKEQ